MNTQKHRKRGTIGLDYPFFMYQWPPMGMTMLYIILNLCKDVWIQLSSTCFHQNMGTWDKTLLDLKVKFQQIQPSITVSIIKKTLA